MSDRKDFPPAALAWSVWGLGALLYLIGFYQRVAPAVEDGLYLVPKVIE